VRNFELETPPKPRLWVAGLICAATVATSTFTANPVAYASSLAEQTTAPITSDFGVTGSAQSLDARKAELPLDSAALVKLIHDESGLTWEQLSRALNVSRRSVHLWASGGRINARHSEMIMSLAQLVRSAPVHEPSLVRAWLYASDPGVRSPMEAFQAQYRKAGTPLQGAGYTSSELLGTQSG
jgi:DNA-binding transcriptional regulator YiaG